MSSFSSPIHAFSSTLPSKAISIFSTSSSVVGSARYVKSFTSHPPPYSFMSTLGSVQQRLELYELVVVECLFIVYNGETRTGVGKICACLIHKDNELFGQTLEQSFTSFYVSEKVCREVVNKKTKNEKKEETTKESADDADEKKEIVSAADNNTKRRRHDCWKRHEQETVWWC
ncbi:hypothetical protein IV203_002347 [Nitzschia inconspicua]|uniref:Uncharacterized protein n=1 Tax=Nitzschia inconspicua TaxID=303405 RepID=A0A9K3PUJ2_9STRA|nr:hypothetical protein IV203_002347 [Nitzschia inconspicua]